MIPLSPKLNVNKLLKFGMVGVGGGRVGWGEEVMKKEKYAHASRMLALAVSVKHVTVFI